MSEKQLSRDELVDILEKLYLCFIHSRDPNTREARTDTSKERQAYQQIKSILERREVGMIAAVGIVDHRFDIGENMKVFVWESVGKCSDNYHERGGVVVFAETEERARELANKEKGCKIEKEEKPDDIRVVTGNCEEAVFIMPDAGCC